MKFHLIIGPVAAKNFFEIYISILGEKEVEGGWGSSMIEFIKSWVLNIVMLAIFIVLLEILVPSGKIKKFVNLISGFILIIAIINPVLGLINKDINIDTFFTADSNFIDRTQIEKDSKILNDEQMKQISELYRQKLIKQLEDSSKEVEGVSDASADIIINEDYNSSNFGDIKRAYISLKMDNRENNTVKPIIKIGEVQIGAEKKPVNQGKKVDSAIRKKVEDKIYSQLGLQKDKLVIQLAEE